MENKEHTLVIFKSAELEADYREKIDPAEKSYDRVFFLRCSNVGGGFYFVHGVRITEEIFRKYFTCAWTYVMGTFQKMGLVKPMGDGFTPTTKKRFFELLDTHNYGSRAKTYKIGFLMPRINGYRENFAFYADEPHKPVTLVAFKYQVWNTFCQLVGGAEFNLEKHMGYTRRGIPFSYVTTLYYRQY